jgi:hypothetical protein
MSLTALHIQPTSVTPEVHFDASTGIFAIKGRSIAENAIEFFEPVITWVKQYSLNPAETTTVTIQFEYINTSSSKSLMQVLNALSAISGKEVNINWLHKAGDEAMKEAGEDFNTIVNLPFHILSTDNA